MPNQTSPEPTPTPSAPQMTAAVWALGNGALQVPLAGLLASDPSLRTAELTAAEWQESLTAYLSSTRI